jgi:hypothetical protein
MEDEDEDLWVNWVPLVVTGLVLAVLLAGMGAWFVTWMD